MRTNGIVSGLLITFLLLVSVHELQAGAGYDLTCTNDNCGFNTQVMIGRGMHFQQVGGFCKNCNKWVQIRWKLSEKAPALLSEVWDPMTGSVRQVYKCPECSQAFMAIRDVNEMKFCPKCNKPTPKSKLTIMYD